MKRTENVKSSDRTKLAIAVAMTLASLTSYASAADLDARRSFTIAPQSLSAALLEFSEQAAIQIMTASADLSDRASPGISGEKTAREALEALLQGTGLKYRAVSDDAVAIEPAHQSSTLLPSATLQQTSMRMAQAGETAVEQHAQATAEKSQKGTQPDDSIMSLEEVKVTGSHIRAAENLSAPVFIFDREHIEQRGYATTQQFVQSLPQNLGTVSDTTFGTLNGGDADFVGYGAGPNLRGLGGSSTLVLVNGHRVAPAGTGNYVDISIIPLSMVERIEVMTDGASAIYGSDAVAGVINFVLRKDIDGAETKLSYGSVTEGSYGERTIAQMLGRSWQDGHALLAYEYLDRSTLAAHERDFVDTSETIIPEVDLIPRQKRQGVYLTLSQRLSEAVEVSAAVSYAVRDSKFYYDSVTFAHEIDAEVTQKGATLGVSVDLPRDWQLRVGAQGDQNHSRQISSGPFGATHHENESFIAAAEFVADGPLVDLPGGPARLAFGGAFRSESYEDFNVVLATGELTRDVSAIFAEIVAPWVGADNRLKGVERLEVTVAGRYEEYSDFGHTFNGKAGLSWFPTPGLNVRGTLGTSFKAPLLSQMNPATVRPMAYFFAEPGQPLDRRALYVFGSSLALKPEEATTWTLGVDLEPISLPSLKLSATFFDIHYEQRIAAPWTSAANPYYHAVLDPAYSGFVTWNPSQAQIDAIVAMPGFANAGGYPLVEGEIELIGDGRLTNLASAHQRGMDFSASYRIDTARGVWTLDFSGTRLFKHEDQLIPTMPPIDQLDRVWKPVDFRSRFSVAYSRGAFTAVGSLNYVDGYKDVRPEPRHVASWSTVDLNLGYDLSRTAASGWLSGTRLSLAVINALDRDPPYVANPVGLTFDAVNATALGRFITLSVIKRW